MSTFRVKKGGSLNVPVRIYAFAKDLGMDNKQLLDICEQAGVGGKGSALASLSEDEITTINSFLAGPPPEPEPEVVPEPVEEVADEPEVPVEAVAEAPEVVEDIATEEPEGEPSQDDSPSETKTGGVTSAVGGLLNKLRSKSRQSFTSVKATTGTPAVKKASIHDKKTASDAAADATQAASNPNAPVKPVQPTRTSPLFNRGPKAVRDLDSRPKRATDDDAKKIVRSRSVE